MVYENPRSLTRRKNTGKSLAEWVAIVNPPTFQTRREIIKFLKTEHGYPRLRQPVAHEARGSAAANLAETMDLVAEQYKGKESLLLIYDQPITQIHQSEKTREREIAPEKAYVSLRRNKQFAIRSLPPKPGLTSAEPERGGTTRSWIPPAVGTVCVLHRIPRYRYQRY